MASERDDRFAAELPAFVAEIQRLFSAAEIRDYLDRLERTKYLAPSDADLDLDELDDQLQHEAWNDHPIISAEELLRFARLRQVLER